MTIPTWRERLPANFPDDALSWGGRYAMQAEIAAKRLPWGISRDQLRDRFLRARKAADMPHVHWHDLRHTYASWLVQAGQPLTAVRDLLGHSSLSVTNRYSHLAPAHLRAAVDTLPTLGGRKKA